MSFTDFIMETLIQDGGWLTILNGLRVTVFITLLSLVMGTLAATIVCAMRLCKNRVVHGIAGFYIAILRGSPVLLLLMLMSFVVFKDSNLPAPLVAVIAFTLNIAAHVAELIRTSILATDKMQVEAARTLGISKWQAMRYITFPQSLKIAKPVYQSFIVNLIQWTSVVGYVNITDLMRIVNNIGSRTMQPIFMLLIGMILYVGLAYLCYGAFALFDKYAIYKGARRQMT